MPEPRGPIVELRGVTKDYQALRPLRIQQLDLVQGESVALLGLDAAMAEVLVNLLTAGALPDAGDVRVFGEPTHVIGGFDLWLALLDRFGLVSERGVLLDQLSAEQNLAVPFSLEVHRLPDHVRTRVHAMAEEVGIEPDQLSQPLGALSSLTRLRVRLGKALALGPAVILAEHPTATLSPEEGKTFAGDLSRIARAHQITTLVVTADRSFAHAVADRVLVLQPATGELTPARRWRMW
jgi:ABC-type transporter Mla maintaining outer membrane lipid asymmetry ATPase subunit MlaF